MSDKAKTISAYVLGMIAMYLIFAFVRWDFNASEWSGNVRGLLAGMALINGFVFVGILRECEW